MPLRSHGDRPVRRVAAGPPGVCLCIDAMPTSLLSSRHLQCDSGHRLWTTAVIGTVAKRAAEYPSAAFKPRHHVACGVRWWSADIGSILTSINLASTRRVGPHVEGHASQRVRLLLRMPGSHTRVVTGNANRYTPLVGIRSEYAASLMNYQT